MCLVKLMPGLFASVFFFLSGVPLILCVTCATTLNCSTPDFNVTRAKLPHSETTERITNSSTSEEHIELSSTERRRLWAQNKRFFRSVKPQEIYDSIAHPLLSDPLFDPSILTIDAARVIQSSACTPQERQDRIQCFDVLPQDQYSVPLGNTVNMQCVVLNQHGKVQWRAKKILLGYDRSLPGYPRYRIIGDVGRGQHTLQIMDVQLEDAGEYECQVTPVPANNHPLLRRKTELVVLVKPSVPRILYPDVPPPDNQLIISQPDPIVRITVLCVTVGGSPAPSFTWIINNREIPVKPLQALAGRHADRAPPGPPRIISPETKYEYLEGEELKAVCVASPPGNPFGGLFWRWLLQPAQVGDQKTGRIIGFGGRGGARMNEYSAVEAYLRTAEHLGSQSADEMSQGMSDLISEDVQPLHYTLNKEKDQLINTLVIPRITRRYHAAKLICETGHPVGSAHQTSIEIFVKYAPANVTISVDGGSVREELVSGRRESVVYGQAGEIKTLICRTSPYFKQANIKWITQSSDSGPMKPPRQLFGQTKIMRTPDGKSWLQESRVDVKISEEDDRGYVDCRVWSEGDLRVDARVRMDIIYPPGVPVITGYRNLQPVKMAHSLEMTCVTSGGNPPPELAWFRDKQQLPNSEEVILLGRQSSLKLKLVPQRDDNGAHYHCAARNAATGNVGIASEAVVLNVVFPPQGVSVNFHGPSVVPSGQPLVISCQADSSNPVAIINWWHFRCGPAHAFSQFKASKTTVEEVLYERKPPERAKCKSEKLEEFLRSYLIAHRTFMPIGTEENPVPGTAGGLKAQSRLWLRPTWHYHMDYIECRTENPEYGPPVWHDRLQLNITFAPQFLGLQTRKEHVIREGTTVNLDLGPYSNPPVTSVSWFVEGRPIPPETTPAAARTGVHTSGRLGELLALHKISRTHMANYTIVARNDIAESSAVFFLNVTFPASLAGAAEENVTQTTSDQVTLVCQATANPSIATQSFTWYRYVPPPGWPQDVNEAEVQLSAPMSCNQSDAGPSVDDKYFIHCQRDDSVHMTSRLSIYRINRDDVGTYVCEINNGLGDPVRKNIHFVYHFTPSIVRLPRYTKAAGEQGSTVTLTCLVRTEPTPQIGWLKAGQMIHDSQREGSGALTQKHQTQFLRIRPGLYKSTLTVTNLQKTDFGVYQCQAVNIKGEAMLEVSLSGTSTPDVPLNLRLLNSTANSLRVAWTQGFDGGLTQTFQVRWRLATGSNNMFKYADVAANDNHHAVEYLITGLESGTEYQVSVNSMNAKHGASAHTDFIHVRTEAFDREPGSPLVPPLSSAGPSDDNALLIIVAACVFGFVVLIINLVVVTFLVKRRRQRRQMARQIKVRHSQHSPNMAMGNGCNRGFHGGHTSDRGGTYRAKMGLKSVNDPFTTSFMSDNSGSCICCPQRPHKPGGSSYVKADCFENFTRSNEHGPQYFMTQPTISERDTGSLHQFSDQRSQLLCGQEQTPDFGHISVNQLTNNFPLNHSYHSSSGAEHGKFGTTGRHQMDAGSSRPLLHSDIPQSPQSLFGPQSDLFLPHQSTDMNARSQFGKFTPRQLVQHPRYSEFHEQAEMNIPQPIHLSREYLHYNKSNMQNSSSSAHKSMVDLLWSKHNENNTGTMGPLFRPTRPHFKSSPSAEFLANDFGYRPKYKHSLATFESATHIPQMTRNMHMVPGSPRSRNIRTRHLTCSSYGEQDHFSDGDNGYDKDRYAAELRRLQYGGGPTVELLLGNNGRSQGTPRMDGVDELHPTKRNLL
ncbi:hypothetical protein T265_02206 [Opisthorchis viverrini]|uniref:Nephrin n=1 Tax=Opisthorchis viverrini TaxID=6198 RepID=A0A074ZVR8_OPIVI|nr:hypothetical protein T265_02206 [Opisthorchis viverrini]KER31563.1 hypothetical protein T265_02206 [Opisthorchis viverrini]